MGPIIDAILMASGGSHRFGKQDKLLFPFNGRPLAHYPVALFSSMVSISNVFFIISSPQVAALAQGTRARVIHNTCPEKGSGESVRLGVVASAADYYLFVPCDQPLLDEETVLSILQCAKPGHIVVPQHNARPGNPTLFSNAFRNELLALQNNENARIIKQRHPQSVTTLNIASPLPLFDIDTPQQAAELTALAGIPPHR